MSLHRLASAAILLSAFAAPAVAQPAQQTVNVWSFGFGPRPIMLAAGRPVTLTFVNRSGSSHDFTAGAFFANATIVGGAAPGGEIELPPHAVRSVTLIPKAGNYPAHCSHFMHGVFGMRDRIIVN